MRIIYRCKVSRDPAPALCNVLFQLSRLENAKTQVALIN